MKPTLFISILTFLFGGLPALANNFVIGDEKNIVVPFGQECERLLNTNQLLNKKINKDGYEILSTFLKIPERKIIELYNQFTETGTIHYNIASQNGILERKFENAFYIDALIDEEFELGPSVRLPRVLSQPLGREAYISQSQAQFLRYYLLKLKKVAERSAKRAVEFTSAEIRVVEARDMKPENCNIWYHHDSADLRFTVSLMGPSTFIRDGDEVYTAPSNVPLLFGVKFAEKPAFHGHPCTPEARMILVGSLRYLD